MPSKHIYRTACLLLLFGTLVLYSSVLSQHRGTFQAGTTDEDVIAGSADPVESNPCELYRDTGNIAVTVKTGATEVLQKLPAMLNSSLACIQDLMVFSDLEQKLGDLQLHDVLARFSRDAMKDNADFDLYWELKKLASENRIDEIASLSDMPERGWRKVEKSAAWALDKYKFCHMVEMAYELQPGRDWYLFIEADTYLSWANLNRWLASLGHDGQTEYLYFGNAMRKSTRPPQNFAHGGSGIVLSGAAVKKFSVERKGAANRADWHADKWWAGDMLLADILHKELSIQVTDVSPVFHHMDPSTFEASEQSLALPAVTVHHANPEDFEKLHHHEQELKFSGLLLSDAYAILSPG